MIDDPSRNKGIVDKNIAPTLRAESHGNLPSVVTDSFVALTERRTDEAKELRKMGVVKDTRSLKELTPRDDNLANTLTTGDVKNSSLTDGKRIRRLTLTECLRLQGFPDDWFDGIEISDTQKYRQCGNAVTVNVISEIAKRFIF